MQSEQAYLVLVQNGEQQNVYSISGKSVSTIGRSADNVVSFLDDRCSRYHAKVFFDTGQWYIQDLGSRNGTFVDGTFLGAGVYALQPGQQIQIGHAFLQFGCGIPGDSDTTPIDENDNTPAILGHHSGIFGVSDDLRRPNATATAATEIINQQSQSVILKPPSDVKHIHLEITQSGFGPVELCRLAYNIGKAEEIDNVAKLSIEGLLNATGADGAGLWLFPYTLQSNQQASDIRLVANATLEDANYIPVSEHLVRTVFDKKEAFLFHEASKDATKTKKLSTKIHTAEADGEHNNTLAAPIRFQSGILGLIHLYTLSEKKQLNEADLEYTLAVADTLGVALAHIHKQKELAANLTQARSENINLREMLQMNSEIIGTTQQMKMLHHLITKAAEGKTSLLVRGESGTGKELIARAVHFASPRKAKPLVCLNCAALSESLLESELFGHERGSFTGATERKIGKFEAANGGTLFLDEIGEMTPNLQSKMLRVLESSAFQRVGGNQTISVDVRLITATNRDLEKEVAEGRFRHDLFFRLRVLEIIVPPLRKRLDDIPLLATHFLARFGLETGRKYTGFDTAAMRTLMNYRWPGNIRELKNVIERAVVLGNEPIILEQDLLLSKLDTTGDTMLPKQGTQEIFIPLSMDDMEKNHIIRTLEYVGWNKSQAAKQLGIERTTLDRKIRRFNIMSAE
ncbi:MAG: sigma 54-interacting transcriptional regulator [Planctomycetaceae bacterium]|jgi:Nif-specific regulatory protein|nr:sigma 54-interacting transcriptional regulator [Planctomycetaceae bacterium]